MVILRERISFRRRRQSWAQGHTPDAVYCWFHGKNGVKSVREMLGVLGSGHAVEGHLAPANDRNSATFDPSFDMGDGQSHTFASHAAMSKETLPMIRRLLGHATHQSTARHAHLDDEHLLDAAQRVGNAIERLIRWITKSPDAFAAVPPQIST